MAAWNPFLTLWSVGRPFQGDDPIDEAIVADGLFSSVFGTDADGNVRIQVLCDTGWKLFAPASESSFPQPDAPIARPWTISVDEVAAFRFMHHGDLSAKSDASPLLEGVTIPQRRTLVVPNMPRGPYIPDNWLADLGDIAAYARLCQTLDRPGSFVRAELDERPAEKGLWWLQFRFPFRPPLLGGADGLGDPRETGRLDPELAFRAATDALTVAEKRVRRFKRFSPSAPHQREAGVKRTPFIAGGLRKSRTNLLESFAVNSAAISALHGHVASERWEAIDLVDEILWPSAADRLAKMVVLTDGLWWAKHEVAPNGDDTPQDVNLTLEQALAALEKSAKVQNGPDLYPILSAPLAATPARPAGTNLPSVKPDIALLDFLGLRAVEASAPVSDAALEPAAASAPYHYIHTRQVKGGVTLEWRRWVRLRGVGADVPLLIRVRQPEAIEQCVARRQAIQQVTLEGLDDCHALDLWTRLVSDPLRQAAERRYGRGAIGLLPGLAGASPNAPSQSKGGYWIASLILETPIDESVELMGSQVQPAFEPAHVKSMTLYRATRRPAGPSDVDTHWFDTGIAPAVPGPVTLKAAAVSFPNLLDHDRRPLTLTSHRVELNVAALGFRHVDGLWSLETPHELTLHHEGAVLPQVLAIGGLDLNAVVDPQASELHLDIRSNQDPLGYQIGAVSGKKLQIPLSRVDVGGSDDREPIATQPLVWSRAPIIEQGSLVADDLAQGITRISTLSLKVAGNGGAQHSSVSIIDPAPMSVATVKARQLKASTGTADVVATWNTGESYWRITRDDSEPASADLILPPQGVAEAWERSGGKERNHLPPDQIGDKERVPARLVPTTKITIETEERPRNPVAPWNLRRLLGDIDVDLPGGRLIAIERLEALYGLEARASRLTGLRIAETVGWRGTVRRPLSDRDVAGSRFGRWKAAARLFDRRLAVLDVRAEATPLTKPVIEDVGYRLRPEGRYVEPVKRKPDGSSAVTFPPPPPTWRWTPSDEGGILGGALAGFEQPSLIEDLLRDAANGRGRIDGLMLSALGAWTGQRAEFNDGLSLIAVELHMGRVDEVRFERKGRIGALHHLGKHVIVYRRSFLPGRQFRIEQNYHAGRPIVRKAEEYIEITQPVRRYPDRAGVPVKRSGPLLGGQFRTVRIPVNGSWAQELPDPRFNGYYIPLWRPDADNAIYPRPVVEMLLAGDPAKPNSEPLGRRVENPDELRFYTLTGAGTSSDVEAWPNVYGLDVEDRPIDDPLNEALGNDDFQTRGDPARPLPPAVLIPPGLERFTLRLEQGPGANLGQGRFGKPILADLRTVTIMRGARVSKTGPSPAASALRQTQRAKSLIGALGEAAKEAGGDVAKVRERAKTLLGEIADRLPTEGALTELFRKDPAAKELTRFCTWVHDGQRRIDRLVGEVEAFASGLPDAAQWERDRAALIAEIARAHSQALELTNIDHLVADVFEGPLTEARTLREQIGQQAELAVEEATAWLERALAALQGIAQDLPAPLRQAATEVRNAPDPSEALVAKVRGWLQAAGSKSRDLSSMADQLEKASGALGSAIEKNKAKLQKIAPKQAPALLRLAEAVRQRSATAAEDLKQLQRSITGWIGTASAGLEEWEQGVAAAQATLAAALDEGADALTAATGDWMKAAERSAAELQSLLQSAKADLEAAFDAAFHEAESYVQELGGLASDELKTALKDVLEPLRKLADQAAQLPYPQAEIALVRQKVAQVVQAWAVLKVEVGGKVDRVCQGMEQAGAVLDELIAKGRDKLLALIPELDTLNDLESLLGRVGEFASALDHAVSQISNGLGGLLDGAILNEAVKPSNLAEDIGLNLLRAAGAPPIVEQLIFNREQLAYYFENEFDRVVTTPVTALLDQGEAVLRGMGVALPTLGIEDTLLAPMHQVFADAKNAVQGIELKAKEVLKDFAGLKDMMPKLNFDSEFARAIKITHDYDASRRIAWLQGTITYGPKTAELFSYDAFAVIAEKMSLNALSRYERSLSGEERRQVSAKLASDWLLQLGGTTLVRIKDAVANYDDRKGLSFDIKPQNIEFAGAIQLLTNALKSFNKGDQPLTIELIEEDGKPVGLKSRYDMPPTTFGFGAVTILNASLGVHLDLAQRSEFEIRIFAYFGRQSQPFSLIVGWLGGGGYLEAEAIHRPRSQSTEIAVALSVGACAGAGFSFGPLAGYVQVYLGLRATYHSGSGGSRLNIAAIIVVSGSVTAWGFVTVSLGMTLAITYQGSAVVGRGHVDVSVRISRFYKKKFSRPINYRLGG